MAVPSNLPVWPVDFPKPDNATTVSIEANLVRTRLQGGNFRHRPLSPRRKQSLDLSFTVNDDALPAVMEWINENCYGWFTCPVISHWAGRAVWSDVPIRFIVDARADIAAGRLWRVSAIAEIHPDFAPPVVFNDWVVARTPDNLPTDWIVARTPDNPATDIIVALGY
jgi:hypothetical protein